MCSSDLQQYGNMLSLEKLAQNGVDGDVSIARLANMKDINNKDMQELADIAAQFLKPRESQHGAAQRAFAGLGLGAVGGPVALAASIATGRITNAGLDSNALRRALLQQPGPQNALTRLASDAGYASLRAAPVAFSRGE